MAVCTQKSLCFIHEFTQPLNISRHLVTAAEHNTITQLIAGSCREQYIPEETNTVLEVLSGRFSSFCPFCAKPETVSQPASYLFLYFHDSEASTLSGIHFHPATFITSFFHIYLFYSPKVKSKFTVALFFKSIYVFLTALVLVIRQCVCVCVCVCVSFCL